MATKQPADKSHFILPDLGEGVHEAELIKWRVKPGEKVSEHQTLAEMETDKALVEVPSPWTGVIKDLNGKEGDILKVGSVLVTYDIGKGAGSPLSSAKPQAAAQAAVERTSGGTAASRAGAKSNTASEETEDAGTVVGSVSGSLSVSDRFARRQAEHNGTEARGKALATPAVRRVARELGVDLNRVQGSGRGGRVTASDVHDFAQGGARGGAALRAATRAAVEVASKPTDLAARRAAPPPISVDAEGVAERIPFRGVRRKIAQALSHSVHTAVHFTVVDEADVTALDRKRKEYSAVLGQKLSFLPLVMTAVCQAIRSHPALNANVDDEKEEILIKGVINLGCAVDTDHGLMVPVIRDADRLSIAQLSDAVRDLAAACRDRTIPRESLIGGTFTISNVGSYGGMFATPIINYPEVGILAAGRVYEKVLTRDGMFYAGKVLPLSLSCDHRVVDGAEGARFLNTVVKLLEKPDQLLGH
jgi:pyruvate dehydrogenase E2 component (dihydrolipoamide acetyltransferase)